MQNYKKNEPDFQEKLQELHARFKGKGGTPESESAINNNKYDLKDGFVWFYSDNCDVSKLIQRSDSYILEVRDHGHSVDFKMDKRGFRSCINAFKVNRGTNDETI